jgi:hypothetical protein
MKKTKSSWKHEYHRLLTDGPKPFREGDAITPELVTEMKLMSELIDAGYADGNYQKDHTGDVSSAIWNGPTVPGRLFADELSEWIKRRTWAHRIKVVLIAVVGALASQTVDFVRLVLSDR